MQIGQKHACIYRKLLFIVVGLSINLVGKYIARHLQLPLWMDSIGTGITACVLGPVYGSVCGGLNNLVYGLHHPVSFTYMITNIALGLIIGFAYKKGEFKHFFNAITISVAAGFAATVISTPLNLIFWDGMPGNVWGDALYSMLSINGLNNIAAIKRINFDKVVSVLLLVFCSSIMFSVQNVSAEGIGAEQYGSGTVSSNRYSSGYAQTIYNNENGLASGEANDIVETPDGYIWIGTYAGLYRYDGSKFTLMSFDSVKNVNCLYIDSSGRLWIGTNDNGVSVYENGRITEICDKKNGLSSNSVRSICEDGHGNYYIGTSASLCIVNENNGLHVSQEITEATYVNTISSDGEGRFAAVTNSGDLFIIKDKQVQGHYILENEGEDYCSCMFSSKGKLYVGTSANKVYTWLFESNEPDTQNVITTGGLAYIHSMYEDKDGCIWICSDSGIGHIKDRQFFPVTSGTFNSSIENMLMDYQGNLWFASSRFGVLKMTQNGFNDLYGMCGITPKVVNSVVMWKNNMYSGTDSGLDIIDTVCKVQINNDLSKMFENNRIRCLFVDADNNLWIATSGGIGLVRVNNDNEVTVFNESNGTIGDRFRSVMQMSNGTIVAAENTGIDFIVDGKVVDTLGEEDGLTNPQILSLVQKDDNTLYAGSDGDGIMVIRDNKVVDRITDDNGLTSGVILRMLKIQEGIVIVTSNSLCFMDNNDNITELKEFPYSNNYDVIPSSDGKLWVLGSAGIYLVNKKDLLSGKQFQYELLDGRKGLKTSLTANSWNCINDNTLYFSGNNGVFGIDMSNYMKYSGDYKVMADYVDTDNNSYALREGNVTKIPDGMARLIIRPELLNYTLNDPYVSYYLEGIDENEYVVQQSQLEDIAYTNLPVGEYIFHMSVLDDTGDKVIESHAYIISKQPQFWEHSWFMAYLMFVCIMVIVYITWMFAVMRSRKIINKQQAEIAFARKQAIMGNETIIAIAKTVDAKDVNTSEHSERVSQYSVLIAKKLGWTDEQCENLRKVALLHDIGKIGIPDSILNKPSRLTEDEYAVMKSHVVIGSKILKDFTIVDNVQDGVMYHHERYDGKGYVEGLSGEQIPKDARIIGIADAFDAMTSNRVYRNRMNMDYVVSELKKGRGTQFDPQLVDIMMELLSDGSLGERFMSLDEEK